MRSAALAMSAIALTLLAGCDQKPSGSPGDDKAARIKAAAAAKLLVQPTAAASIDGAAATGQLTCLTDGSLNTLKDFIVSRAAEDMDTSGAYVARCTERPAFKRALEAQMADFREDASQ